MCQCSRVNIVKKCRHLWMKRWVPTWHIQLKRGQISRGWWESLNGAFAHVICYQPTLNPFHQGWCYGFSPSPSWLCLAPPHFSDSFLRVWFTAETQLWWGSDSEGRSREYPCGWHWPLQKMWFIETRSFSTRVVGGRQTPARLENILRNLGKCFFGLSVGFFHLNVQFNT